MNTQRGTGRNAVAVPSVDVPTSVACLRSLRQKGVRTILLSDGRSLPADASRYADEIVTSVASSDDLSGYRDALLSVARRDDVATIVPVCEADVFVLSKFEQLFEDNVSVVVPSLDALETVHDRVCLVDAAEAAGVPAPETRLLSDADGWNADRIIKSRYNLLTAEYVGSFPEGKLEEVKGVTFLRPGEQPDVGAIRNEMHHDPIVQEFVPRAGEYMFAALYDRGEPLATFQHEQIRGNSYVGGGGVYRKSIYDPELETVARRLLDHLDWHGLACIEYVEDVNTGEFKLVEINPRMWQSLSSTVRSGADFPHYYWLRATGRGNEVEQGYELDTGSHFFHGELGYLTSVLFDDSPFVEAPPFSSALWDVVSSCVAEPHFDYLHRDDPGPFVRDLYNTALKGGARVRRWAPSPRSIRTAAEKVRGLTRV